jgi:hypothetical protein
MKEVKPRVEPGVWRPEIWALVAALKVFESFNIFFWKCKLKGIVSPDWKGLQMVSLDRFEV